MRIVLISGSSSGFGAECARAFATAGDRVIATARDPADHPLAGRDRIEVRALDVTDSESIDTCVDGVLDDHGRVDVLVNNAGIHLQGAIEDMDQGAFRRVLETNFFGAVNLARAVLPSMRRHGRGHVISVSSIGARVGRVIDGAYCASKAALEIAMEALRHEVARFGIQVCVVSPGAFRTDIARKFEPLDERDEDSPYHPLLAFRQRRVRAAVDQGGDPAEVARLIVSLADEPAPPFRHLAGERAAQMEQTLEGLDNAQREALIIRLAETDWWRSGEEAPRDGEDGPGAGR